MGRRGALACSGGPPGAEAQAALLARCAMSPGLARRSAALAHLELAGDPAATLELDLAVVDVAGHHAAGVHAEAPAHREIALVGAADLGLLDLAAADEPAGRLDLDRARVVQRDLDVALDDQAIAGRDLALELDALADDQALAALGGRLRRGLGVAGRCAQTGGRLSSAALRGMGGRAVCLNMVIGPRMREKEPRAGRPLTKMPALG